MALARGGSLPWNTASAMVTPTTAAMAKIRTVIHMAPPFYTSRNLYVIYSAAAVRLQVARAMPATCCGNVSVAVDRGSGCYAGDELEARESRECQQIPGAGGRRPPVST